MLEIVIFQIFMIRPRFSKQISKAEVQRLSIFLTHIAKIHYCQAKAEFRGLWDDPAAPVPLKSKFKHLKYFLMKFYPSNKFYISGMRCFSLPKETKHWKKLIFYLDFLFDLDSRFLKNYYRTGHKRTLID